MNLRSLLPFAFAYTTQVVLVAPLAVCLWLGLMVSIFGYSGRRRVLPLIPGGVSVGLAPIVLTGESAGKLAQPVTLGFRLLANLFGGHMLLVVVAGLIGFLA